MGLDQYFIARQDSSEDFEDYVEVAYRRKHPSLHGWFEKEAIKIGLVKESHEFNSGVEVRITPEMLERLSKDILQKNLPETSGFFFGSGSDEYYYHEDLELIKLLEILIKVTKVYYTSWW